MPSDYVTMEEDYSGLRGRERRQQGDGFTLFLPQNSSAQLDYTPVFCC